MRIVVMRIVVMRIAQDVCAALLILGADGENKVSHAAHILTAGQARIAKSRSTGTTL